ncbi:restriction endonuclease subunit S [Aliarcobacter cryaerophilus]|nr:restriction endonuclease subunit S [Arcobacter sp. AZ-2023]
MSEYADIGVPFYRSKEIIEKAKGSSISTELFISEDKFNDIEKKFGVPVGGDILLTSVGTIGIPYLVQEDDKFYFKDGNLTWFKNFSNELNNKFMLCWLQSKDAKNQFDMITIGSTQKALTISSLKELEIPLPSLSTQKKIAHILSTLDDKIELNRKMNQTLEEMASAIFKSWFVDFDPVHAKANCTDEADLEIIAKELGISKEILDLFPNEFEESELGMIPKGWEVINLSEHIEVIKGKSYKSDELQDSKTALVTLKSFLRGGGYRTDGLKPYIGSYKKEQVVKPGEMIIAYTDVTQSADVIGKPAIVLDDENIDIFVASLDVGIVRIKTDDINLMFLYQLFRTPSFQGYILGHTSGTTVLHLSKSWLENFVSFVPNNILMRKFQDITQPLFDKFNENIKQSRTLEKTRDTLLPKLLSGEIDVSALEIK